MKHFLSALMATVLSSGFAFIWIAFSFVIFNGDTRPDLPQPDPTEQLITGCVAMAVAMVIFAFGIMGWRKFEDRFFYETTVRERWSKRFFFALLGSALSFGYLYEWVYVTFGLLKADTSAYPQSYPDLLMIAGILIYAFCLIGWGKFERHVL